MHTAARRYLRSASERLTEDGQEPPWTEHRSASYWITRGLPCSPLHPERDASRRNSRPRPPPLPAAPLSFSGPRLRRLEKAGYIDGPSFKQRRGTPHHDGTHSRNVVRTVPSQAQSAAAAVRTAVLGCWLPPHHAAAPSPNAFVVLAYSSNSF